jgi:hypothetical protein
VEAFVIGPIGDQLAEQGTDARTTYEEAVTIYEEVIVEAWVAASGDRDKITRGDFIDRPGDIPEQVIRSTLDAHVVIADLTGANANVMYELALRHASGRPSAQIGEKGRLPFDVSTLRTLLFKRSNAGLVAVRRKLTSQLEAIMKASTTCRSRGACSSSSSASRRSIGHRRPRMGVTMPPEETPIR